jgi:hypothetical protein
MCVPDLSNVEHPAKPGMDEPRGRTGLAIESLLQLRHGNDLGTRHLQRDLDVELQVQGEIDRSHPTAAQLFWQAIAPEVPWKRATWIWCDDSLPEQNEDAWSLRQARQFVH